MRSFYTNSLLVAFLFVPVKAAEPVVTLNYGAFQGKTTGNTIEFLGIPFAAPPVGNLRFALPQFPTKFVGIRQATTFGAACPQLATGGPDFPVPTNQAEDCLFVNIVRPANVPMGKKLPILFWIYGGGFQFGDASMYDGKPIVNRSLALDEPVIVVSANYRLNGFGFLGGSEIKAAKIANAGLRDQRFALEWVKKYIALFGGDSKKVTIWGESAGALSIGLQLVLNKGNSDGLYRGAFMQSGALLVLPKIESNQIYFDKVSAETNCTSAADKIQCLRDVPYEQFKMAIISSSTGASGLVVAYQPTIDGDLVPKDPYTLFQQGKYARVPIISGNCEDEGTLLSVSLTNITTNAQYLDFVKTNYFPGISEKQISALEQAYPDDITKGSPFNTGTENAITPQYKRISAFQGDWLFQAPRRFFMKIVSKTQPTWGFRYLKGSKTPILGSYHSSDIPFFFNMGNNTGDFGVDALVYFAANLNPNPPRHSISPLRNFFWPIYTTVVQKPALLTFLDSDPLVNITTDTYRAEPMTLLTGLALEQVK